MKRRSSTLEEQVLRPIQDPNERDLSVDAAAKRVGLKAADLSQALASYVRSCKCFAVLVRSALGRKIDGRIRPVLSLIDD